MRQATLSFLIKDNGVCLAMKKRGFGVGKGNGVGGKGADGETVVAAASRETEEEIGVRVLPEELEPKAVLRFYFNEKPEWNQEVHVFVAHRWDGEPQETEEMRPQWYRHDALPFSEMWIDDPHWLPNVLAGKKLEADFYFNNDGAELDKIDVREV